MGRPRLGHRRQAALDHAELHAAEPRHGRVILYSTLGVGGTAYFSAKADLSTLLEDLALVRPTKLDLVPRIWEMLFQEIQSQVDNRMTEGADRDALEAEIKAEQREKLIGGRQFSAMTGSAPISPELYAWTEDFIDIHLANGYGSTEDGVVLVDDQIRRPPIVDYKLVDVPDLGYFSTDRPHPRGDCGSSQPMSSPATTSVRRSPPNSSTPTVGTTR